MELPSNEESFSRNWVDDDWIDDDTEEEPISTKPEFAPFFIPRTSSRDLININKYCDHLLVFLSDFQSDFFYSIFNNESLFQLVGSIVLPSINIQSTLSGYNNLNSISNKTRFPCLIWSFVPGVLTDPLKIQELNKQFSDPLFSDFFSSLGDVVFFLSCPHQVPPEFGQRWTDVLFSVIPTPKKLSIFHSIPSSDISHQLPLPSFSNDSLSSSSQMRILKNTPMISSELFDYESKFHSLEVPVLSPRSPSSSLMTHCEASNIPAILYLNILQETSLPNVRELSIALSEVIMYGIKQKGKAISQEVVEKAILNCISLTFEGTSSTSILPDQSMMFL